MANIYLRWKNPDCNGIAIEWEEMSGKAFFAFLNSNSSEGRYFIKLNNDICFDANVVFIEATKAQYDDWLRDSNRHHYLKSHEPDQKPDSLDATISGDGGTNISLYEAITDMSCVDPEEFVIHSALLGLLPVALSSISKTLRETIVLKYFKYPGKSDEEIAELIGVTKDNFKKNRQRALKELKSFFEK